jgi:GAF domain-containing protein
LKVQSLHNVNKISTILMRTPGKPGDLTSVLQHIAQTAQGAFAADSCVVLAFNPITGSYIGSQAVVGDSYIKNELLVDKPRKDGITQQVLEKKDGVICTEDLAVEPQYHNRFTLKEGFRAFAGLAMRTRHRQRPLGVIFLDYKHPKKFSSTDYESFRFFAVQAAFLLQETWLAHHYEEIARIGQKVNQNLDTVDDLFQELQTYVDAVLDNSHTFVLAINQPQTNTLEIRLRGREYYFFMNKALAGACEYVIRTQESCFIKQWSKEKEQLPFQIINLTGTEENESHIFVPLILRGVSLGVLSIQHHLPEAYGQEDLFVLQLLANYISLALHNMRLYKNLSQLNETGQLLTQQLVSEQTLQITVDQIQEVTKADIVILYAFEASNQYFVFPPRIAGSLLDSTLNSMNPDSPDAIAMLMLSCREPIFAKESATLYSKLNGDAQSRKGNFEQREKVKSTAALSLRVDEELVGVLFVNFRQPQHFDAQQKLFIEGLAHYAAIAIKNAQAFGTLSQRRVRELEILQHIDRELNRTLDLEPILNTLLQLANEQVHADEASVLLQNTRTKVLEIPAAIGPNAEDRLKTIVSLQETKGITRWVLEHKKPARVGHVLRDPQWRDLYIQLVADIISELDVPLLDGENVIGILNFESTREDAFRQEDEDFLLTLAGQAVLAIKNAQAYEREKRLTEEERVLNQISKEITSQLNLDYVLHLILEKALELTHSTRGNLMLYDRSQNDMWLAAVHGSTEKMKGMRQSLEQGVMGYAARNKQLLNVDLSQPPWKEIYLDYFPGTHSELAVPMLVGDDDELLGVLNVESLFPNNFSDRDERLLRGLADLAVIALQNAQAYEREKRLVDEGQVLNQISKEITSQLDHVHVFDLILEKALELTHSNLGNLMLYDPDQNDLWMAAGRGVAEEMKGQRQRPGQGIVGYAAKQKRLQNVEDVTQSPWNEIYIEFFPGARSELAVPMLAGGELRGVLNVESPVPHNFSESDERLLQGLADLAMVALQNAERYQKAEQAAERFELLYEAGQELSKITDFEQLEQAYHVVVQIADRQSQSLAVIYRYDEENAEMVLKSASLNQQAPLFERLKLYEGLNGQVARERRTIVVHDINNLLPSVGPVKQSDPNMHSFVVTPILFEDQYYGNLGLRHKDVGHFRDADIHFYEGLAQQLASTIYRLETVQARKESEQRAKSAEAMSEIGQMAFELTHRWDNDLGLVRSYVNDIQLELEELGVNDAFIAKKLDNIVLSARTVLDLSRELKQELVKSDEAIAGEPAVTPSMVGSGEPIVIQPRVLFEEAQSVITLPSGIEIVHEIDEEKTPVLVIHNLVADILRNLISNAIDAMPNGGKITLKALQAGHFVAMEVTDEGFGISQQHLSKIFDLFYSTKGSSGFGLWSARRNSLRNHGNLVVNSEPGQGTTFTLLLPRVEDITYEGFMDEQTHTGNRLPGILARDLY